jgi:predicted TPR repeat methyltransferase
MTDREAIHHKARSFFESLWQQGDYWTLESSEFEQAKYSSQLAMLGGRRYQRVLEIGCGAGHFTRQLAPFADRVVGLDVAPSAVERARSAGVTSATVDVRLANVMDYDPRSEGPWDLIVMSETVYYLGWLYPFFDVAYLASELFAATSPGGHLLLANTCGGLDDYLLRPWAIHTYRDLFLDVGYGLAAEEVFRGNKDGTQLEALISLFAKPLDAAVHDTGVPGRQEGQRMRHLTGG